MTNTMVLPSPAQQTSEGETSRKRRRIIQACEECRDRKRKCDGVRPVCGACSRRPGQSCVWNDDRNTKGWSNNYVEGLRARIKELESAQAQTDPGNTPSASTQHALDSPGQPDLPATMPTPPLMGPSTSPVAMANSPAEGYRHMSQPQTEPRSIDEMSEASSQAAVLDNDGDDIDAMGVVRSTNGSTGRARRPSGYFGPSSTFSLLGDAYSAINDGGPTPSAEAPLLPGSRQAPRQSSMHLSVPLRAEADELLGSYWTWVHSLYPFLHRPSFTKRYHSVWAGPSDAEAGDPRATYYDDVGDHLFHCILNLVFAMGALFNPAIPSADRDGVSRTFFGRAKALVDLDMLAAGSTVLVQALLLMSQYLQSTDAASSCWNTVGLAVRVAQGVGLHHEPREDGHGQIEIEMRRRAWTGAVVFDRVLSLTYGRPLMIHPSMTQSRLRLPVPVDDEFLTPTGPPGEQPAGVTSLVECYVEAVRLQDIIGRFVASFNQMDIDGRDGIEADGRGRRRELDLQMMLDVEDALGDWEAKLPVTLQAESYTNGRAASICTDQHRLMILQRQANVLQVRCLHGRLALLRPALSVLCKANNSLSSSSMGQAMIVKAANLCVTAARDLIDAISGNVDPGFQRLPAPWYNVFYVHSSAIVLLLGYICTPGHITCMDEAALIDAYNRCLSFFREYSPHSISARRCSKVLQLIQQKVFRHRNGQHEPAQPEGAMPPDFADAFQVPPLSDPRDDQVMIGQNLLFDDVQLDQMMPGMILDNSFDTTWLSQVSF